MEYGLIGEHLGHSFSPIIHGKIADYPYELKEIAPNELDLFMKQKDFKGINVTIPYKQAVIPYLDEIDEHAKAIGAVNTIVNRDGRLIGYNTDFYGMKMLCQRIGVSIKDKKVLVLGTGGTSHTANAVATALGAKEVITVGRKSADKVISYEECYQMHADAEYIINTTPCGMYPNADGNDNMPSAAMDIERFPRLCGVVDAVFNPLRTNLVVHAKNRDIAADGGLYMLVAQAVAAAEKFLDTSLDHSILDRIYKELKSDKENIVLVGMPGCGKSTVGKALADLLGRPFIDSDDEIVQKVGKDIPTIFKEESETGFRRIEADVIADIAQSTTGAIIATGGGAILRDENVLRLKRNGRIYFIDRPIEHIPPTPTRPLSMDRSALQQRYNERYPRYLAVCDFHIKTDENIQTTMNTIKENFFQ